MNFFNENLQVFKKVFVPLFALVVVSSNIDQYLNLFIENALRDPNGAQNQVYLFGFLSIITSIFFPVLLTAFALYALNQKAGWVEDFEHFIKRNLNQLYIETLRSWGKTLLWSLVFILPGVWKFLELCFVPFVVTSSKRYDAGQEDALQASAKVFKKHWGKALAVLFCFHLFMPIVFSVFFDSYRLIWKTPVASLILSALDTYLLLLSTHILFNIFKSEVSKHEAHV